MWIHISRDLIMHYYALLLLSIAQLLPLPLRSLSLVTGHQASKIFFDGSVTCFGLSCSCSWSAESKSIAKLSWVRLGAAACPRSRIWTNPTPSRRPWPSMELSTYSKLKTESSRDTKNIHHLFRHFQGLINDLGTTWKVKEREATLAYSWQMSPSVQTSLLHIQKYTNTHTHTSTHYNIYNSPSHPPIHCQQQEHNKHRSFGLDALEDSRDR